MANQLVCSLLLLIAATSVYADGIVGGVATTTSARSYIVSVQSTDGTFVCGGALYNNITVITAASCLNFYDSDQLVVGIDNGNKTIDIAGYTFDTNYDFTTNQNDVGLLRLKDPVSANYVKLPSSQPTTGTSAVLTGWDANNSLVDVSETIITADDCGSGKYNYEEDDLDDSMLCGLAEDEACGAIAGSPLVSDDQLYGVVSWGYGCGNKANPAVFTNIYSEKSWITSTINSW